MAPTLRVETVSARKNSMPSASGGLVTVEATSACGASRPSGARFGSLVHAVLATIDLDATRLRVEALATANGKLTGATVDEQAATVDAVVAALAHPIIRGALAAGKDCRREAPVLVTEPDGSILEGVLDLAFRTVEADGPTWTVVDYKTDRELDGRHAEYEAQVLSYVRAVAAATGERARGILLRV